MSEFPDPGSAPIRKPYTAQILAALSDRQEIIVTTQHPQRDQQFRYIRQVKQIFINAGYPVISVDTKKADAYAFGGAKPYAPRSPRRALHQAKELIGNFKNAGQTWNQEPDLVNDHEFPTDAIAKAVPYGIYNLAHNHGCVYVGTSHDTAAFAVAAIVWWFERKDRAGRVTRHAPKFASDAQMATMNLTHRRICPQWNYVFHPRQQCLQNT